MTIKLPHWGLELQGNEVCSEENCTRPAVYGIKRAIDGENSYQCQPHCEIDGERSGLDFVDGTIETVEDWISQVVNMPESAWTGSRGMKDLLILRDEVSDFVDMPYRWQHECTLKSLSAALDVARKLTQEKIARLEKRLEIEEEYPGDPDGLADGG